MKKFSLSTELSVLLVASYSYSHLPKTRHFFHLSYAYKGKYDTTICVGHKSMHSLLLYINSIKSYCKRYAKT